jgi:hypothetical protein
MEVAPMLRQLLTPQSAKNAPDASDTRSTDSRTLADKLARRSRMLSGMVRQPKSICTSLKDLCEL